ncbi:transcription factor PAP1-domain-containing protein [Podospora conica]|nr:transcription factor PAP1-domain-containing protein [Schizothecium conicum]
MASSNTQFFNLPALTPEQEQQLYNAIAARGAAPYGSRNASNSLATSQRLQSYNASPAQNSFYDTSLTQGYGNMSTFQNSSDLDNENDFSGADLGGESLHNDTTLVGGNTRSSRSSTRSASDEVESADKRRHPDDEDDEDGNDAKRRESGEKTAKKPGRKPILTEPTSKRKAQNRAAQRAFRERKEKHVKDLETKVEELEKTLKDKEQSTNHKLETYEAEIEKLKLELSVYKSKALLPFNNRPVVTSRVPFGAPLTNNINDVNFEFKFPKFGAYGAPQHHLADQSQSNSGLAETLPFSLDSQPENEVTASPDGFFPGLYSGQLNTTNSSRHNSSESHFSPDSHFSMVGLTSTTSPSASSHSNMGGGPSSSCGTSPEPFTQSPKAYKPIDTLTIIGEEQTNPDTFSGIGDLPWPENFEFKGLEDVDLSNFANFSSYRDPSTNFLAGGVENFFFDDAYNLDLSIPANSPPTDGAAHRKNLIAEIDAAKEADEVDGTGKEINCASIWKKLVNCEKTKNADFDLDGLCKDLSSKAKCSGNGEGTTVVDQKAFKEVMKKYLGDECGEECAEDMAKSR